MANSLSIDDLNNCSLIIDRGLFFYKKLSKEYIEESKKNRNTISELSFYIRSLSEITTGIELWFKSAKQRFAGPSGEPTKGKPSNPLGRRLLKPIIFIMIIF